MGEKIKCSKCGKEFDPYSVINFKSGYKARSTCPFCGHTMSLHKVKQATGYVRNKTGWTKKVQKLRMSKKQRLKLRRGEE